MSHASFEYSGNDEPRDGPYIAPTPITEELAFLSELANSPQPLLDIFHRYHTIIEDEQSDSRQTFAQLGSLSIGINRTEKLLWPNFDPSIMPSDFTEIRWIPHPGSETARSYASFRVCFPEIIGDDNDVYGEAPFVPNDVCIVIGTVTGDSQQYLLNGEGLQPYGHGNQLKVDVLGSNTDVNDDSERPNVLLLEDSLVSDKDGDKLTIQDLNTFLLRDSLICPVPKPSSAA